jgi:predicted Zn-dependent peptidase
MVLAAAGGVQHEDLVKLAQKYFGNIEIGAKGVLDYEPGVFKQSAVCICLLLCFIDNF